MRHLSHWVLTIVIAAAVVWSAPPARADDRQAAEIASGVGTAVYLTAGVLLPLATDGDAGGERALRAADALLLTSVLCEGLKRTVREKRPESKARTSFPSGHTAAAFSVATAQSRFHPDQAPFWYGGAIAIGWSRVRLNRHYTHDVVAGAALGYFTTRWALSRPRGVILSPYIPAGGGVGVAVAKAW